MQIDKDISMAVAGWLVGFVGALFATLGLLVNRIFKRHEEEGDARWLQNLRDHERIHDRIDKHLEGE